MRVEPPTGAGAGHREQRGGTTQVLTVRDPDAGGPGGEDVAGTHVCALYSGPEQRDRLLASFMQGGLRNGDPCVCLFDGEEPARTRQRAHEPVGARRPRRSGQVGVFPTFPVTSRAGALSAEQLIGLVAAAPAGSPHGEVPPLRAAADMSWLSDGPGATELLVHESAVNEVLAERPAVFLCMYDLQRLRVSMLVDVLRTHSEVLLDATEVRDAAHLPPTDDAETTADVLERYPLAMLHHGRGDGDDQWLSLTGAEVGVTQLVASGMTNRAVAEELGVSRHTVDAHLKHIYLKLDIHSRVELTVLALQHEAPVT